MQLPSYMQVYWLDQSVWIHNLTLNNIAGDSKSFQFTVQSSPVSLLDFYMLIDLSNSISDDLSNIEMFSQDIGMQDDIKFEVTLRIVLFYIISWYHWKFFYKLPCWIWYICW